MKLKSPKRVLESLRVIEGQEEPLPPKNAVFDVPFEEMERVWEGELAPNVF